MNTLNIAEIEQAAALRLEIAKKVKELRELLRSAYPGYDVFIEDRQNELDLTPARARPSLGHLTGVQQIELVLREASGQPVRKTAILTEINERGGNMNVDTLTAYLSRYDRFINAGYGLWRIEPSNYSNGAEIFNR